MEIVDDDCMEDDEPDFMSFDVLCWIIYRDGHRISKKKSCVRTLHKLHEQGRVSI